MEKTSANYSPTDHVTPHDRADEIDGWNIHMARKIARSDGLELTQEHSKVLYFLRNYYIQHGWPKKPNDLTRELEREFEDMGGSRVLYLLFPDGPLMQGAKIAGLPPIPNVADDAFGSVH